MSNISQKDPLAGKTLEVILKALIAHYGWQEMGDEINVKCFIENPSLKSSLTFLRRTPWARTKVERMYLRYLRETNQLD